MTNELITSANKPVSVDGKTYHVEIKRGQVANRILTVGDPSRARLISKRLDKILFAHESHRGFLTITGIYRNVPVSIVAIGMGLSMMDFFVREARMVVSGPLSIIRLGSCGSICSAQPGDVIVASGAFGIGRNYEFFSTRQGDPYIIWPLVKPDERLTGCLRQAVGKISEVFDGDVGNADSFYGSQGRTGDDFDDANGALLQRIHETHPRAAALEMESHMLFHLAEVSTGANGDQPRSVRAACALVVFADRSGNTFICPEKSTQVFGDIASAVLDALIADASEQTADMHPAAGSVWENEL
ncbi:hypothetical protein GGI25_002044 [Coemansia spiralis]|uniref:Nucleoside phosphorylase domain-containing protein n=2 Tax=Coemansia TaxID=4863 RepID=A0A9W8KZG4_9FUNG|nr:hypothetical protein EDC05_002657 [Coemansia umbellata]KAJ2623300.1 hypothetical protein GGI26_002528 [Coemansia sp. RSA 1358]KAJ2678851.1 hypothetical protein GGI25_002044 [Coemansia spiralis]